VTGIDASFWRAITVFRIASLCYAAALLVDAGGYRHPVAGWAVVGVMVLWTVATALAYSRSPSWPLLAADLLVTLGCLSTSPYVQGPAGGAIPVTATWVAGPVLAWAVHGGRRAGVAAAVVMAAADIGLRGLSTSTLTAAPLNGAVLLLLAGLVVGHVSRLARQAEERLQRAARQEAASRERERLARGIHDSVLQVLALVQRRGLEIGGETAELGRLAGKQERALRELVRGGHVTDGTGLADLGAMLHRHGATGVTVSTAASPLLLPADLAREIDAAVRAALDNVGRHAGDGAKAWVFAETDEDSVTVTVRDDGAGVPDGRLERAAAEGRLGVAKSIVGRIADLGGTVSITSTAGQGTEVELTVPLGRAPKA
jgi:signal transduction histidine kinase